MADNETPVVAAEASAEVKVEPEGVMDTGEIGPAQNAKEVETIDEKEQNEIKQEEEIVTDVKEEVKDEATTHIKQEVNDETTVDVKQETKDEASADVEKEDSKAEIKTEDKKPKVRQNHYKFDPTKLPESDDPAEIRKQVEFYFSASNLPFDKFLFGLVGKENKPVPLNLVASFKRMKRFPNKETIISALKESEMLELGGDSGEETIKRKVPLEITEVVPREVKDEKSQRPRFDKTRFEHPIAIGPITDKAIHKSIYAKGFGTEGATTQVDIEKFFEPFGPISAVRLRRTDYKLFKGSVFVEFIDEQTAEKFMALEEKPTWEGKELLWKTKLSYVEEKLQDIKDGKIEPKRNQKSHKGGNHHNNKGRDGNRGGDRNGRGGRGRGGRGGRGRGGGRFNDRRGGGDRDEKRGDREGVQKDDNGIPKLKNSSDVKAEVDASTQNGGNKRKAGDDGENEIKKPKIEE